MNVIKNIEMLYKEGFSFYKNLIRKSIDLTLFYLGYQWSSREIREKLNVNRQLITNNQINRSLKQIIGEEVNSYQKCSYITENPEELQATQVLNTVLDKLRKDVKLKSRELSVLKNGFIGGISFLHYFLDRDNQLRTSAVPLHQLVFDPTTTEQDLSDCRYVFYHKVIKVVELQEMFPDSEKEIENSSKNIDIFKHTGYSDLDTANEMHYQYNDTATTNQIMVITELFLIEEDGLHKIYLLPRTSTDMETLTFITLGEQVNPLGELFRQLPFSSFYCDINNEFFNDANKKYESYVSNLRGLQENINRLSSMNSDIVASSLSGYAIQPDALEDPNDIKTIRRGGFIRIKKGSTLQEAIQKTDAVQISPTLLALEQEALRSFRDASGVTSASLGEKESAQETFSLTMMRKHSAASALASYLFNFHEFQKTNGAKLILIFASITNNMEIAAIAAKLDLSLSLLTDSEPSMNRQIALLLQLKNVGEVNVSPLILIKNTPLSAEVKAELIQNEMQTQQQKAQIEQLQLQISIQKEQLGMQATAITNMTEQLKGVETIAKTGKLTAETEQIIQETEDAEEEATEDE